MIRKLFLLQPGDSGRILPFFILFMLVHVMLTLGDGISLALFVHKVGAERLPFYYGITALCSFALIGYYIAFTDRVSHLTMFNGIISMSMGAYFLSWLMIGVFHGAPFWYGLLFIGREVTFNMVIMHFGTLVQDYFNKEEMNRVIPIIYAGGRLGGVLGGGLLGMLSVWIGAFNLIVGYLALGGLICIMLLLMRRLQKVTVSEADRVVPANLQEFFKFIRGSSLLMWLNITTILFIICRWVLNFQYSTYFQHHFATDNQLASFIGWYTTVALIISFAIQLMVTNRTIAVLGLVGAHFVYTVLMLGAMGMSMLPMTLMMAMYCRFIETELRLGFRSPIVMLMTNQFARAYRTRARAFNLGAVIPMGTLLSSILISLLQHKHLNSWIPWLGFACAVLYFVCSFGFFRCDIQPESRRIDETDRTTQTTAA